MKKEYIPQFDYDDLPEGDYKEEYKKITFKEKIFNALGTFGIIVYYGWSVLVSVLPFVMIDFNFWLTALFIGIELFFPPATIVFWIWGLIAAFSGVQDIWAIIYYILSIILFLPFFINIIVGLVESIKNSIARNKY